MSNNNITTKIMCNNIAPIKALKNEFSSKSLEIAIFASNGSGKTFLSKLFRLTENYKNIQIDQDGKSPSDKFIRFGESTASFSFVIRDSANNIIEDFKINIEKGKLPTISNSSFIYHTFNQEYIEENIKTLNYEKDGNIEGFILGKANIDLSEDEKKLAKIKDEGSLVKEEINKSIAKFLKESINEIPNIKQISEYKLLCFNKIIEGVIINKGMISESFEKYYTAYKSIESVPDNLKDINTLVDIVNKEELISEVKNNCENKYSLSNFAEDFKKTMKQKQSFIESGVNLLQGQKENKKCPFCEQDLKGDSIELINNYTRYLTNSEAKVIRNLNNYKDEMKKYLLSLKEVEQNNIKSINEFDKYKQKYFLSDKDIELGKIDITKIEEGISTLILLIDDKIKNISISVKINDRIINSLNKDTSDLNEIIKIINEHINKMNDQKNNKNEEARKIKKELCKSAYYELMKIERDRIMKYYSYREDWKRLNEEIEKKREQQKISKKKKVAETITMVLNIFFKDKYKLEQETFQLKFGSKTLEKNEAKEVLSEGEKNIIAFAYYLGDMHLKIEKDEDYKKIFFIIDDPISSMDFNHVYTLCGIIRDLKKTMINIDFIKYIIFTHNTEFMRILIMNNIIKKKLLLKNNDLKEFNNNSTVPYISHLIDIYKIANEKSSPDHTTANSIRHILETLVKFEHMELSEENVSDYIKENIPNDSTTYTLINDLSHGSFRTEDIPIDDVKYVEICKSIIDLIDRRYVNQLKYCEKLAK